MPRTKYTKAQRDEALKLYAQYGAAETARRTGIKRGTLQGWASRAGITVELQENREQRVVAASQTWELIRADLANKIGQLAVKSADQLGEVLANASPREAAIILAILVDKAQLLSGGPTARTESVDKRGQLAELVDELAAQREKAA